LRQSVHSWMAGYEDVNDAGRLSQDPTFRLAGSEKICERGAALTSRLQSFETELLTRERKQAVEMTRLSYHLFRFNEVRLWLSLIAYNLGNLGRRLFGAMLRRIERLPVPAG
jgi:hypothetical protein